MALTSFMPTLWSDILLASLKSTLVYAGLCNRNYEGDIRTEGATVKINTLGSISVGDYTGADITIEDLTTTDTTLAIDQKKYFGFKVDDVDRAQGAGSGGGLMEEAMRQASYDLATAADKYIAGLYTEIGSEGQIGSDSAPITLTKDNVYDHLVDLATKLDDAGVPDEGRWVVLPPWAYGLVQKDSRFVGGSATDLEALRVRGFVGQVAGLRVYKSNNVPNTTKAKYKILAGHSVAITYAEQILHLEAFRPDNSFKDAVKGLHVYGAKVIRPNALAVLTASPASA